MESPPAFKANEKGQYSIAVLPQGIDYVIAIMAKGYGLTNVMIKSVETQTNHYEIPTFVLKRD